MCKSNGSDIISKHVPSLSESTLDVQEVVIMRRPLSLATSKQTGPKVKTNRCSENHDGRIFIRAASPHLHQGLDSTSGENQINTLTLQYKFKIYFMFFSSH